MAQFAAETIFIDGLRVDCIIGVGPHERETPQPVLISLSFPWDFGPAAAAEELEKTMDYAAVARATRDFAVAGRFRLLETLARRLAQHLGERFGLASLHLRLQKPAALPEAQGAAVSLTWHRENGGGE